MKIMFFLICCLGLIIGFYGMSYFDESSASVFDDSTITVSTAPSRLPLGPIHNNFWNVKRPFGGGNWLGAIGYDRYGHAIFEDPAYGVRAAIRLLQTYQLRHDIDTIAGIINRWAPPEYGNPTKEYATKVARKLGLKPGDHVSLFTRDGKIRDIELLRKTMAAMAEFECGTGFYVDPKVFERGLVLLRATSL